MLRAVRDIIDLFFIVIDISEINLSPVTSTTSNMWKQHVEFVAGVDPARVRRHTTSYIISHCRSHIMSTMIKHDYDDYHYYYCYSV